MITRKRNTRKRGRKKLKGEGAARGGREKKGEVR